MEKLSKLLMLLAVLFSLTVPLVAAEKICAVYLTGVGCPNCAATDPVLLTELTNKYPELVIIEYEIYEDRASNQEVSSQYFESYREGEITGIPFIVFDGENSRIGKYGVEESEEIVSALESNSCPMPDGTSVAFDELDLTTLPGKPKIWSGGRVLLKGEGGDNSKLKALLVEEDIVAELGGLASNPGVDVGLSGGHMEYKESYDVGGWVFQRDGNYVEDKIEDHDPTEQPSRLKNEYVVIVGIAIIIALLIGYDVLKKRRK